MLDCLSWIFLLMIVNVGSANYVLAKFGYNYNAIQSFWNTHELILTKPRMRYSLFHWLIYFFSANKPYKNENYFFICPYLFSAFE